jgi:AcrR family transcriptional regulator
MAISKASGTARNERTKTRILAYARQVFQNRGFRKVTVEEICAGLGMGKPTFYRHFEDRDDLAVAVVSEMMGRHAPEIIENLTSSKSVDTILQTHFDLLVQKVLANVSTQVLADVQVFLPEVWERIELFRTEVVKILTTLLLRGQEQGLVRQDIDPSVVGKFIQGVVSHMATPAFVLERDLTMEQFIRTFQTLLMHGVLAADPGESPHEPDDP